MVVLSVDPIESAMAEAGLPPGFERGLAAYLVAARVAETALSAGIEVLVDAVSSVEPARELWREVASRARAAVHVVVCEADERVLRARSASRDRGFALGEPAARQWRLSAERLHDWYVSRTAPRDVLARRIRAWAGRRRPPRTAIRSLTSILVDRWRLGRV